MVSVKKDEMKNKRIQKLNIFLTVMAVTSTLLTFGQDPRNKKPTVLPINEAIGKEL